MADDEVVYLRQLIAEQQRVTSERFDLLDEMIEAQDQQIAGLMTAYVELTAVVDAIFETLDNINADGIENVPSALADAVNRKRRKMIELLEGVSGTNMEAGDPSPGGSVEDVVEPD